LHSGNSICIVIELGAESKLALCGAAGGNTAGGWDGATSDWQTDRHKICLTWEMIAVTIVVGVGCQ